MRCDTCGWRISKKEYNGQGECFRCFEGLMKDEQAQKTRGKMKEELEIGDVKDPETGKIWRRTMKEESNLSKKMFMTEDGNVAMEKDVKEFIRRLKKHFNFDNTRLGGANNEAKAMVSMATINEIIDRLASKELVG